MNYNWNLKDTVFTKDKGKVFSCFSCGGGSTMGYKLAGFDVIGCNEIDPRMMNTYILNHNPKFSYLEGIQTFKNNPNLPDELYNLDILDGSPPCSSFSTAGNREKDWGKDKKFKEGQVKQILDTLFFDFIDLAKRLQPKVVIAENVEGILLGKAKKYVRKIYKQMDEAGYYTQHFLLDASKMGVPQTRKRVFFIGLRKDLSSQFLDQKDLFTIVPTIDLRFNMRKINFSEIQQKDVERKKLSKSYIKYWENANESGVYDERSKGGKKFGYYRTAMKHLPLFTIISTNTFSIEESPHRLTDEEFTLGGSFPTDYNFNGNPAQYIIGMSVPPLMIARIAERIYNQWLIKL